MDPRFVTNLSIGTIFKNPKQKDIGHVILEFSKMTCPGVFLIQFLEIRALQTPEGFGKADYF